MLRAMNRPVRLVSYTVCVHHCVDPLVRKVYYFQHVQIIPTSDFAVLAALRWPPAAVTNGHENRNELQYTSGFVVGIAPSTARHHQRICIWEILSARHV